MEQPKAHHFIPVGHLARFSSADSTVPARDRGLHVFDKRSGSFRIAKTGKVAFENDLYTFRQPNFTGVQPEVEELLRAVFDPRNKDAVLEQEKADFEQNGLRAIAEVESWSPGIRHLGDEERVAMLSYVGLLIAQHPTMMRARWAKVRERSWRTIGWFPILPPVAASTLDEMDRGAAVLAMIPDGLAAALELNYLAWKVLRWEGASPLILGDVGVVAFFSPNPLSLGSAWSPGAKFALPLSTTSALVIGGHAQGICVIEDRSGPNADAEVAVFNVMSWARSKSQVFARERGDLERTLNELGPLDPRSDHSSQFPVRESVLPLVVSDGPGDFHVLDPSSPSDTETHARYQALFGTQDSDLLP